MTKVAIYVLFAGLGLAALIWWALSGGTGTSVETTAIESSREGKQQGESAVEGIQEGKRQGEPEKAQEMAAKELKDRLPIQIDETKTLQSAINVGKTLIYYYKISLRKSDIDKDNFIAEMRETLRHEVCQKKPMRSTLNIGGMYKYVYLSSDGLLISEITITSSDCAL